MAGFRELLAGLVGLPANRITKGIPLGRSLRLLKRAWEWPPEEVREHQARRLRTLLNLAGERFPFYRKRLDAAGLDPSTLSSTRELRALRPLSRQDLQALYEEARGMAGRSRGSVAGSSSGSTGTPIRYWKDPSTIAMGKASLLFGRMRSGWRIGARTANVWGNPRTVGRLWTRRSSRLNAWVMNEIRIPACELSTIQAVDEALGILAVKRPEFISGYANSLHILAQRALARGLPMRVRRVFTTAETLLAPARECIERAFGPVTDMYGTGEINGIAFQCPDCGLYHTVDPHVLVEYESTEDSDLQSILVTDLDNRIMPLIRYRVGDLVSKANCQGDSPCGCSWGSFGSIRGRLSSVIEIGGRLLNPITYFGDSMGRILHGAVPGLITYRTVWDGTEFTTTLYMRAGEGRPKRMAELEGMMAERLRDFGVRHSFVLSKSIPETRTGKRSFFEDRSS
jgi:phenylacetate-CoA ligase